ncbi:MAG TPA: tryptophan 7-halogenase [Cellvibrionaceae bacterium]
MIANKPIKNIVIVGGGAAGWSAAVGLARGLHGSDVNITVIDADAAFEPAITLASEHIHDFHKLIGIRDEQLFKSGIAQPWIARRFYGNKGECYLGNDVEMPKLGALNLHQLVSVSGGDLSTCSLAATAARRQIFAMPQGDSPASFRTGYILHTHKYCDFLRGAAKHLNVRSVVASVATVECQSDTGFIEALTCKDGTRLEIDLVIDHSNSAEVLWRNHLPPAITSTHLPALLRFAERAAGPARQGDPAVTFTRLANGWQQKVQAFGQTLLAEYCVDADGRGPPLATGVLATPFYKNTLAIGMRAGFSAPPSVSVLNLAQRAVAKLLDYFPGTLCVAANTTALNTELQQDQREAEDYLALLWQLTDSLQESAETVLPSVSRVLQQKQALFASSGRVGSQLNPLITEQMWINALWYALGELRGIDPLAYMAPNADIEAFISRHQAHIQQQLARLQTR